MQALHYFKLDRGIIVTANQADQFEAEGKHIDMIPAYHYLNQSLR